MQRPQGLPDYEYPPLDEVVLGVQFAWIEGYSSVHTQNVWGLFKDEYPHAVDQFLIPPYFETFSGNRPAPEPSIQLGQAPKPCRLWFSAQDDNHLLQFQPDRFLLNWRKKDNIEYPRFEKISSQYQNYLEKLSAYTEQAFQKKLKINQAELTYVNIIPVESFGAPENWFSFLGKTHLNIESMKLGMSEVVYVGDVPSARIYYEVEPLWSKTDSDIAYRFSLTYRGKPDDDDGASALKFMQQGRLKIVSRFDEMTTSRAHEIWGKK